MERKVRIRVTAGVNDATAAAFDEATGEPIRCSARLAKHPHQEDKAMIVFASQIEVSREELGRQTLGDILLSKIGVEGA